MTPADERITTLLEKWRRSLDLHARYTELTEDQYWLVQPWPQHERPNRWIVDLASQRLTELLRIFQSRVVAGDPSLSEALELMLFLANLVGSHHVQRYIPLAEPEHQRPIESLTVRPAAPAANRAPAAATAAAAATAPHRPPPPPSLSPAAAATGARTHPPQPPPRPVAGRRARGRAPSSMPAPVQAGTDSVPRPAVGSRDADVIHDAVRLLSWGRQWHELPHAIARMSGRPDSAAVREILKTYRAAIECDAADKMANS